MLRKKGPQAAGPTPDQSSETMERRIRPKREELYDRDATAQYQREWSLTVFMIMIICGREELVSEELLNAALNVWRKGTHPGFLPR